MMPKVIMVWCTFPDMETARAAAKAIISEQFAACVNIAPGVESHFQWQGQFETTNEVLTIWKTTRDGWEVFSNRLKALHPYETPEIIATEVIAGHPAYLAWVAETVS
jgi:periplasmic divalent cation tolerance protein